MPQQSVPPAAGPAERETRWLATLAEVRRQAARVAEAAGVQVRLSRLQHTARVACRLASVTGNVSCAIPAALAGYFLAPSHGQGAAGARHGRHLV